MTITVLTSASGSPGVTTTALGLTVHWPESCLLVDTDYQKAVLTGYLEGATVTPNHLVHVINAARYTATAREAVWRQAIPLPDDDPDGRRRLLLPGLPSPATTDALKGSWRSIAAALCSLDATGIDVIVDLGRLTPDGVHPALLEVASNVLLMIKPTLRAVGAAHWAAQRLVDQHAEHGSSARLGLLLVRRPLITKTTFVSRADPTPRGFDAEEIEAFLPLKVRGVIVHDPVHAALLSDGGPRGPKFGRSSYATSLLSVGQDLARSPSPRSRHDTAGQHSDSQHSDSQSRVGQDASDVPGTRQPKATEVAS
jgi:hypothetical protein